MMLRRKAASETDDAGYDGRMQGPARRRVERRGSWLALAVLVVLLLVAALWLLFPLRLF
jgi:hypothetical protein